MRSSNFIQAHLPPHFSITIDSLSVIYSFTLPQHACDIVWWSDQQRELLLFELTISFESLVAGARERKRAKYQDLVEAGSAAGYKTELITGLRECCVTPTSTPSELPLTLC